MNISQPGRPVELQILFSCEIHKLGNVAISFYNDQTRENRAYLLDVCYVRFVKFRDKKKIFILIYDLFSP